MSRCTALQTLMAMVLRHSEKIPKVPRHVGSDIHKSGTSLVCELVVFIYICSVNKTKESVDGLALTSEYRQLGMSLRRMNSAAPVYIRRSACRVLTSVAVSPPCR